MKKKHYESISHDANLMVENVIEIKSGTVTNAYVSAKLQ